MQDTEPMPTVTRVAEPAETTRPRRATWAIPSPLGSIAALASLGALGACIYLHAEVVGLRTELHDSRVAAQQAERAADRASLAAESARSSLANAEPTDPPEPSEPTDPPAGDANGGSDSGQ